MLHFTYVPFKSTVGIVRYAFYSSIECKFTRHVMLNCECNSGLSSFMFLGRIEDRFKTVDSLNDCMNIFKTATDQKDELRYIVSWRRVVELFMLLSTIYKILEKMFLFSGFKEFWVSLRKDSSLISLPTNTVGERLAFLFRIHQWTLAAYIGIIVCHPL